MPEEINRVLTDHAADLLLAPAQVAAGLGLEAGSYSPATIHRAENTDDVDRLRLVRDSPAGVNHPVALLAHPRLVARCAEHESEPADRGALRAHPLPAYPGWASSRAHAGGRAVVGVECDRSPRCGAGDSRPVLVWSLGVVVGSCKDDLGAYNEPVVFDDATADALVTAASDLSSTISTMGSDVGVWASTASADFEGHYGDVFDSGAKAGQEDCTNISAALDDLVSEVRALKSAAATERRRRAVAKEWADRQDEENLFKQGWDWLTDGDKAPAGPAPVPLPEPHEPVVSTWTEPAPGAAGAVSSARPSDLRTYASNLSGPARTCPRARGGWSRRWTRSRRCARGAPWTPRGSPAPWRHSSRTTLAR